MRFALVCLLTLAASLPSRAADVEFVRVWGTWRDADSFERISEFFTGKENAGRETVARTHPEARAGFYFLARIKNPTSPIPDAKFALQVITPTDPKPTTFTFPANVAAGTGVFSLGLTGPDWAARKNPPVAWKLELLQSDGQVIATAQSFLWELPKK